MKNVCNLVSDLVEYALKRKLIEEEDRAYSLNRIIEKMGISDYAPDEHIPETDLETILKGLCDYVVEQGICEDSVVYRDLFDTAVMGQITPRPSEVIKRFDELYKNSPEKATDYFYNLALDSDYIRTYRVKKDLKWKTPSEYGDIDISINKYETEPSCAC